MDLIGIAATIIGLTQVTYEALSNAARYHGSLSKTKRAIALEMHLLQEARTLMPMLERVEKILSEDREGPPGRHSPTYITPLVQVFDSTTTTLTELSELMRGLNHRHGLSFRQRFALSKTENTLSDIAARLKEHKSFLDVILLLLPSESQSAQSTNNQLQTVTPTTSTPTTASFSAASGRCRLGASTSPNGTSVDHVSPASHDIPPTPGWTDVRLIGSGANGTVTLQSGPSGRLRALKRVVGPAEIYSKEIDALCRVSDRRDLFVEFFGWYAGGGFLYIAMEFVENGDLSTLIQLNQSSPLLEDTCREITRQTLEGLRVLHERHICHRDLKPQNILVARLDPIHVKIADFGVSKCLENTEFRTRVGTSGYIAPELLGMWAHLGRGGLFGYAADLWSMGCIIYEIISCKKPFEMAAPTTSVCSGSVANFSGLTDLLSLLRFCKGETPHPAETLQQCGASIQAMDVVKALLRADPSSRLSASEALELPWFVGAEQHRSVPNTETVKTSRRLTMDTSTTEASENSPPNSSSGGTASNSTA